MEILIASSDEANVHYNEPLESGVFTNTECLPWAITLLMLALLFVTSQQY
jgi:hypothetical protein